MSGMTDDELRDAIVSLRRSAIRVRSGDLPGQDAIVAELERLCREREAELEGRHIAAAADDSPRGQWGPTVDLS